MGNPFPEMNPYLEKHWPDVQASIVVRSADTLNEQLPDDLYTTVHERSSIELNTQVEPAIQRSVRIVEIQSERLITVIEFLNPMNKSSGLIPFASSRQEFLEAGVNSKLT
jgi:hypothetical protein